MISLTSWWWPKRPARVPRARTAGLLAGLGAALFGVSAALLKTGTLGWDESLFRLLNDVPAAAASVLTPLSRLFLPAGIITVVALTVVYILARNRSILPVVAGAAAGGLGWLLAHAAKAIADRPRPYQVMADAVLRQQPAHGTSFPSSHTAVTLAVALALVPFMARPLAATGIGYAVLTGWSRIYLGVHYPLDILGGAGIGAVAGGVTLLALGMLLGRAGQVANGHGAAAEVRSPGAPPGAKSSPLPDPPEHPVPPPAGQDQLPAELPWMVPVPAVDAPAGLADQAATGAVTQAMPAVPSLGHAPLPRDLAYGLRALVIAHPNPDG
jgi:undecaprenyl-diphosphatase